MADPQSILDAALPGAAPITGQRYQELASLVPEAWQFLRTAEDVIWAAFLITGDKMAETDRSGVIRAKRHHLRPILVLSGDPAIGAAAKHYVPLRPFLICEIGGLGQLIPFPRLPGRPANTRRRIRTRVAPDLLNELASTEGLPHLFSQDLGLLARKYRRLLRGNAQSDTREHSILIDYAMRTLRSMGLRPDAIRASEMLRTIEGGGIGPSRDHFFHSFQNYFLGLLPVALLRRHFEAYRDPAMLHWNVDPFHVWFLTAMWHDVGYVVHSLGNYLDSVFGGMTTDEAAQAIKEKYIGAPETQDALRILSSLMSHFLAPERPATEWIAPEPATNLGAHGETLLAALRANVHQSHGSASALRLYCDHHQDIERLQPNDRNRLKQTVLLAACSIPFHDWRFRRLLRATCGGCQIPTALLPFAALLAFVDSIQDDRRDLSASLQAAALLEKLLIRRSTVSAVMNVAALQAEEVLFKIVEARDVVASLVQDPQQLYFRYPKWLAGQS